MAGMLEIRSTHPQVSMYRRRSGDRFSVTRKSMKKIPQATVSA